MERAREQGVGVPAMVSTDYINTIPPEQEPWFPGDELLERRIRAYIRWSAMAMVDRSNHQFDALGGHLSTASAARLVGFNHFFRNQARRKFRRPIYFGARRSRRVRPGVPRGTPHGGISDRFPRGRRRWPVELPAPRRMPEFWEFPTVSMGLGPLNAVYQARFNRYLLHRELVDTSAARVWSFVGDGEMDEPESMAALSIAAREQLDNLIFVVNCNLQRLDGPVRATGRSSRSSRPSSRRAGT